MDPFTAFLIVLGLLLTLTVTTLVCVHRPLNELLLELCGAHHRARFWARFFSAMVLLSVLFFCLWSPPDSLEGQLYETLGTLRAGLFGLLFALGALALVMLTWQGRFERGIVPPPAGGPRSRDPEADRPGPRAASTP